MLEVSKFRHGAIYPPGDTISDVLLEKGIGFSDFAEMLGGSQGYVDSLIKGDVRITEQLASRLSEVLGASPGFWLRREQQYVDFLEVMNQPLSEDDSQWLAELPVSSMQKYGWIPKTRSPARNLINCLSFFDVNNVAAWREIYRSTPDLAKFRTSQAFSPQLGAVAAWIKQCETEAEFLDCAQWDRERFLSSLSEIRRLTLEDDPSVFLPELQRICAQCGVAVVIARTPSGCQASGATKFLSADKALLMLSFRYLSDDHFWFTFFHEAGHLILHGEDSVFVEGADVVSDDRENEANTFSQNFLIPPEYAAELPSLKNNLRAIIRFSRKLGVSPGIVVGQLQHQGIIKPNHMQNLKIRYRWQGTD
ncbi:XRE family transcriptional regulator [Pseudomonas tohonis]|uniref:XRE family transcriptional regulator n=1 Tax=Pseudomonas tohonis TaxID=2725477 RepID=A0A6J4EAI8_9PSED|nr:ImmA/IrrE family metallo-endopeptidase [Pseudomonas tohonis]BCG26983.1 XRE family transcriptional regulator [Pseudomonas tohonis]GJN50281.1 XRE family transcriptional regulator [Pseudomonas tohonis]